MPLNRRFTPIQMLLLSINGMVGSAWLFAPLYAAKIAGAGAIWSWVLGGAATILIALTFAELMQTIEEEMLDLNYCNDPAQRRGQQTVLAMECFYKASQQKDITCARLAKQYFSEIGLQDCRSLTELATILIKKRTTIENYYVEHLTNMGGLETKEGFESGFSFSKKENRPHLFVADLANRTNLTITQFSDQKGNKPVKQNFNEDDDNDILVAENNALAK